MAEKRRDQARDARDRPEEQADVVRGPVAVAVLAQKVPGAGQYSIKSTVGKQVDSTKPSMPQHSFGPGTRAATNKLFISVEHEKSQHGLNSPGPATALPSSSMGRHMNSNSKSQNPFSFGTSKRIVYADSGVPGQGHYD